MRPLPGPGRGASRGLGRARGAPRRLRARQRGADSWPAARKEVGEAALRRDGSGGIRSSRHCGRPAGGSGAALPRIFAPHPGSAFPPWAGPLAPRPGDLARERHSRAHARWSSRAARPGLRLPRMRYSEGLGSLAAPMLSSSLGAVCAGRGRSEWAPSQCCPGKEGNGTLGFQRKFKPIRAAAPVRTARTWRALSTGSASWAWPEARCVDPDVEAAVAASRPKPLNCTLKGERDYRAIWQVSCLWNSHHRRMQLARSRSLTAALGGN